MMVDCICYNLYHSQIDCICYNPTALDPLQSHCIRSQAKQLDIQVDRVARGYCYGITPDIHVHGWSGEGLKLEVETHYLKRVYSVSSDFSRSEWESTR